MYRLGDSEAYASWTREHDQLSGADREAIRRRSVAMSGDTLFSIVIPAPGVGPGAFARRALESVRAQLCPAWELLGSPALLAGHAGRRFVPVDAPGDDPVAFCNAALTNSSGRFLVVLPPDAVLAEHAVFELAAAAATDPDLVMIFGDEDRMDSAGRRSDPHFKTAWDGDLMLAMNAVGDPAALSVAAARALGGLRAAPSATLAVYELILRIGATALPSRIRHVPAILCHRAGPARGWDAEAARAVVRRHLDETGVRGASVQPARLLPAHNHIVRPLPSPAPLVSVVVPTRDGADLLARCAAGVLKRTDYERLELLLIDNDSRDRAATDLLARLAQDHRVRVLPYPGAFNYAAMNNYAVRQARGDIVVLLNNDTDVIEPGWLREMVSHAVRPDIGVVGAKLLYADGRVQHCGVTLGPDWALIHQLRLADRFDPGPNGELALTRTVLAVTGACMAFRKSVFLEVGGLNEASFRIAFNDVDFCLRMGDFGYRVVCAPFAELFHLESVTRGYDDTSEKLEVNRAEVAEFRRLWYPILNMDPFHNPNLLFRWEDSLLAAPPRRSRPWVDAIAS